MKRLQIFIPFFFLLQFLHSAPIDFMPATIIQPDGTNISCFASGDEYYNWLHDAEGYTIIQGTDGWYYYGQVHKGLVIPTNHKAGLANPSSLNLVKWAKISKEEYQKLRNAMWSEVESMKNNSISSPPDGTLNNIAIYIRFADDTEFSATRQSFDDKLNLPSGNSLKSYFLETSYGMLNIHSTHYPACNMTTNLSYQDANPRSYYQPYNATTNPNGYQNSTERRMREHLLLKNAVDWVNINSPVPSNLDIDTDNNGFVDNISFFIRGNAGGWSDLLWAHRWMMYSYTVLINGKQVWDYTLQPENQATVKTMAHEMFHTIGAPDLYHYYNSTNITPAAQWDIMATGGGQMTAYMKWKYSGQNWISNIPEITSPGTYTLKPLSSSTNNCYKILSPNSSSEYYVIEYRQKTGTFESSLPGSGLIIYRVNPSIYGNADGPPDELYIYRPGGTLTNNGNPANAFFSASAGRTEINDSSDPSCFLGDGLPGGLNIWGISDADSTITFNVGLTGNYVVILSSNSAGAGSLSGNGIFQENDQVTVSAFPNPGYVFLNWTENSNIVSTDSSYTFSINNNRHLIANFGIYTIICDTLSNIEGIGINNSFPGGGYASGHNAAIWTRYAEKFSNNTLSKIDGFRIQIAVASGNNNSQVTFNLFDNGLIPGTVLASKTMNISTLTPGDWNYIYFDNPVNITGDFFIGYEISYNQPENTDTFAVYMSDYSHTTHNTAYAFTSEGWGPFTNLITSVSLGTHLWIEAISCNPSYEVLLVNSEPGSGSLSGEGIYVYQSSVKVTASPNQGYSFLYWSVGDSIVSTDEIYEFILTENRVLMANFQSATEVNEPTLSSIRIYPNPVTDYVHLTGIPEGTLVSVTDLQGRIIFNEETNSREFELDMTSYRQGVYLFSLINDGSKQSHKIIRQ